jgi:hypothetical protein
MEEASAAPSNSRLISSSSNCSVSQMAARELRIACESGL